MHNLSAVVFVIRHFLRMDNYKIHIFALAIVLCLPSITLAFDDSEQGMRDILIRLASEESMERTDAAFELQLDGQSVLPELRRAYGSNDTRIRRGTVTAISLLPSPALGIDILIKALADTDLMTRSLAAHGLAIMGTTAAPWLADQLESPESTVRDAASFGLRLMGGKAVPALIEVLSSDNTFARSKAAWLLGRSGEASLPALPALMSMLNTPDPAIMEVAAEAIDQIGPPSELTMYHLTLLGTDTNCPTARIGSHAAPILTNLLTRTGTPLGQLAHRALTRIGRDALPALRDATTNGSLGHAIAAGRALVEIDPQAVDTLPEEVRAALTDVARPNQ